MDATIKKEWLEALRSGEYQQGKNMLRNDDDTFCCLGVLCDIYSKKENIPWENETDEERKFFTIEGEGGVLSLSVSKWAGFGTYSSTLLLSDGHSLVGLNDVEDYTFAQIADVIEKKL